MLDSKSSFLVNAVLVAFGIFFALMILGYLARQYLKNQKPPKSSPKDSEEVPFSADFAEKIEKILETASSNPEKASRAITKVAEAEARSVIQGVRQEFTSKIQTAEKEIKEVQGLFKESEKQVKKLDVEKKTTDAVVRSIADGLVVVNEKGEVLLMNPSAEKLLSTTKEKKIGKSILDDTRQELLISMSKNARADGGGPKTIEYSTKDENTKKIIRSSSAVIQNEDGQTIGMVNILTDITKQRELDEIKNQFISNVTHELRTPIVAMQKAIIILQSPTAGTLNETQANFMSILSRNLTNLSQLVEDVLDIAKIDAGKLKLKMESAQLEKVLNDGCDLLETWARSKTIQLVRQIASDMPPLAMDAAKINQVLNNLLSNSIKFTPANGTVTVTAAAVPDKGLIEVKVSDTGVGISKENLGKLFKRFEQFGDQAGIMGTGLGLSITKEIVEAHGGQIHAESEPGKGAAFIFTLPLKQTEKGGS